MTVGVSPIDMYQNYFINFILMDKESMTMDSEPTLCFLKYLDGIRNIIYIRPKAT